MRLQEWMLMKSTLLPREHEELIRSKNRAFKRARYTMNPRDKTEWQMKYGVSWNHIGARGGLSFWSRSMTAMTSSACVSSENISLGGRPPSPQLMKQMESSTPTKRWLPSSRILGCNSLRTTSIGKFMWKGLWGETYCHISKSKIQTTTKLHHSLNK